MSADKTLSPGPGTPGDVEAGQSRGAASAPATGGTRIRIGDSYRGSDGAMTCALCDNEMTWEDCPNCGGDGTLDGYEEDPNWYAPGEEVPCQQCRGRCGDWWCQERDCKTITCTRVIRR